MGGGGEKGEEGEGEREGEKCFVFIQNIVCLWVIVSCVFQGKFEVVYCIILQVVKRQLLKFVIFKEDILTD